MKTEKKEMLKCWQIKYIEAIRIKMSFHEYFMQNKSQQNCAKFITNCLEKWKDKDTPFEKNQEQGNQPVPQSTDFFYKIATIAKPLQE